MMAYRLNRQLVLESPERIADGAGGYVHNWIALGTVWAKMIGGTGREAAGVAAPLSRVVYKIIVRGAPAGSGARPKADQRFREGDRLYRILSVAEDDADGRFLMCRALEEIVA